MSMIVSGGTRKHFKSLTIVKVVQPYFRGMFHKVTAAEN